jgi:tetratricopeptide (TPR) repeat protein
MEGKLRSLFFTGNYSSLLQSPGKKPDSIELLISRAQVQLGKKPSLSLNNLESLRDHLNSFSSVSVHDDALSETLTFLLQLNTGQECQLIDNIKPDNYEKIMFLAAALLKIRRPEYAEKAMKAALNQDEEEAGFSLLLAFSLFMKGEFEEAAGIANELIAKFGESSILLNLFALCLVHEGNFAKAENLLKKALENCKVEGNTQDLAVTLKNLIAIKRIVNESYEEYEQ